MPDLYDLAHAARGEPFKNLHDPGCVAGLDLHFSTQTTHSIS